MIIDQCSGKIKLLDDTNNLVEYDPLQHQQMLIDYILATWQPIIIENLIWQDINEIRDQAGQIIEKYINDDLETFLNRGNEDRSSLEWAKLQFQQVDLRNVLSNNIERIVADQLIKFATAEDIEASIVRPPDDPYDFPIGDTRNPNNPYYSQSKL